MANIKPTDLTIGGTYNNTVTVDYKLKVFPKNSNAVAHYEILITNWNRDISLKFTHGSLVVTVRQRLSNGTYIDHPTGIPIWVGDTLTEITGQPSISDAGSGAIGTVASINSGTEGSSVKTFTLGSGNMNSVGSGTSVDALVAYESVKTANATAISQGTTIQGHAKFHGLTFTFNNNFSSIDAYATSGSHLALYVTGHSIMNFIADKMTLLSKGNTSNMISWSSTLKRFSLLKDVYNESPVLNNTASNRIVINSLDIDSPPSFVTRGDDTYVGLGPESPSTYIGYPNVTQFGKNFSDEIIMDQSGMSIESSILPALEQFCLPAGSDDDAGDAVVDLTANSQLIVGYVKGSDYLLKGRKDRGVESSIYIGGKIMAIYLDHETNTKVWVLYDGVGNYKMKCIAINASGTIMSIHQNRIYSLTSGFITPFDKDVVIPTDIIFLDSRVYISASCSNVDDPNVDISEKCFGTSPRRESFMWRSPVLDNTGAVPAIGYKTLAMEDITPQSGTSDVQSNGQITPYWYAWDEVFAEYENLDASDSGNSGFGQEYVDNTAYNGGADSFFKLKQMPSKRGLCIYGLESGKESVGLHIKYVENSFNIENDVPVMYGDVYHITTEQKGINNTGDDDWVVTERITPAKIGPFVYQNDGSGAKDVALGSHIIVWQDSEEHTAGSESTSSGVKRIMVNNSSEKHDTAKEISFNVLGTAITLSYYSNGENLLEASGISTTYAFHSSNKQPRGLAIAYGQNVKFWNLQIINQSDNGPSTLLDAYSKDGRYFLNHSGVNIASCKNYTPAEELGTPITLASQSMNYKTSGGDAFQWIAVSFPNAFKMKYITAGTSDETAWTNWELRSPVELGVEHFTTGPKDEKMINLIKLDKDDGDTDADNYGNNANYQSAYYKMSLTFDGYQDSVLGQSVFASGTNPNKFGHKLTLKVLPDKLPKRLSHINIFKARGQDPTQTEPDSDYRLLESVSLSGAKWFQDTGGYVKYTIKDNLGKEFQTYEALTEISPLMTTISLNYETSEECAGFLFVTNANNAEISNVGSYIFRSKPGKYSIFNWANEYVVLPEKPTALKAFNNLLFAFSSSKIYIINPQNLSIIDTLDGMGCLSPESIVATDFGLFFADTNGVYQHNGRNGVIISRSIFTSDNSTLTPFTWDSIGDSLKTISPKLAFDGKRKALLVIFEVSNNSYAWVYSVELKRWDLWSFTNKITAITQGKYGDVLASDGKLLQIGTNTARKPWQWESKKITAGYDTYEKQFKEIHVEGTTGVDINYKTSVASGSWNDLTSSSTGTGFTKGRLNSSHSKAKWLQIQAIDTNGLKEIESIGIHLRPLKAKSIKV